MSEILWTELEKVDVLRERMGLTYEEARLALEEAQGDLVKALANKEKELHYDGEGMRGHLWDGLKHQMNRLSQTQVKLKRRDKTILSVSAPLGIAMAYTIWRKPGLRFLGLLGAAGAAMKDYHLEVDTIAKDEEDTIPYSYHEAQTAVYPEA